jgi:hypothetical protein
MQASPACAAADSKNDVQLFATRELPSLDRPVASGLSLIAETACVYLIVYS